MTKGIIIGGEFGRLIVRQKSSEDLELGELLVAEDENSKHILQVVDLQFASQISQQNMELISGMNLEQSTPVEFFEQELRNYKLGLIKSVVNVSNNRAMTSKQMPSFFSNVREIVREDLSFLTAPKNSLLLGSLRSGSKMLDVPITLDGSKVLSHHILIAGTTGRGKSTVISNMLWSLADKEYCGMLVLDPHDEYFGRTGKGLKDHPAHNVVYYTARSPPAGAKTLKINLESIKPTHFSGVADFSDPQKQAMQLYNKYFGAQWIKMVLLEKKDDQMEGVKFMEQTLSVVKRRLINLLDLEIIQGQIVPKGIFDLQAGTETVKSISSELADGKTVIIDTSTFSGAVEILIGGLVASEVFARYKYHKMQGTLDTKPVISVVIEEAPRVLGKEVLERGPNIFSTIAREGRKFKIGVMAITQLPSLIPREILANMNTKIILGIEMKPERQAIIESASQDLSDDDRTIASLDVGEALVSSNFAKFAIPIKIPFFEDVIKKELSRKTENVKREFKGIKL